MAGYAMAPPMEPPEAQSIRSMLHIVRILAIIFGILLAIGGIAYAAFVYWAWANCNAVIGGFGGYCGATLGALLVGPIILVIFGIVDFVIYTQMRAIEGMMNQRQYEAAKSKTLVWMILGFILGGILLGVILLIAYIKFDPLISWQRSGGGMAGPAGAFTPGMAAPPGGPVPPGSAGDRFCPACGAGNSRTAGFCAKCGKPLPPA